MTPDLGAAAGAGASLSRLAVAAAVLGAVAVAVLAVPGYPLVGLFGCVGLALGLANMALVRRAAGQFAASEDPSKKSRFALAVLGRLAAITAFAILLALAFAPAGLGVFAGLVAFQALMILSTSLPMLRQLRSGV